MAPVWEITLNLVSQPSAEMLWAASAARLFSRVARAASRSGLRLPVPHTRSKVIDAAVAMGVPPITSTILATFGVNPKLSAVTMIGLIAATETVVSLMRVTQTD